MFSHVMVGSNDLDRSKKFYDALFVAIGGKSGRRDARNRLIYIHNGSQFMVTMPIDGQPASHANGGTIGFSIKSEELVDAWHKAGIGAGGTAIESPPGARDVPDIGSLYLAYLRDPDGNKLCAVSPSAA